MTRNFRTYCEALDFMCRVNDRYEVKIIETKDGFMVICER